MDVRFLRIAVIYLVVAGCLGLWMGITSRFTLAPVHAHLALAGWLTLAVAGVVYRLYPAAAGTRLAQVHFWLHNIALPVFMAGLALLLGGHEAMGAVAAIGATAFLVGLVCFAANVLLHVRAA